ncbi:hypothetical protein ACWDBD_17015 [Streptomyces sp. NPDC001118]
MTITQDLRTRRKHRGKTPFQLVQTIGRLEREADEATCQMVALATENDELRADRNRLAARLDDTAIAHQATVEGIEAERDGLAEELAKLKRRFAAQIAVEANVHRVDVPPMYRDTSDPADQATAPIDVKPLWEAFKVGTVTVVDNPDAANPARTTL